MAGARFLAAAVNAASMHDKTELEEVPDKLNNAYYETDNTALRVFSYMLAGHTPLG